MGRKIFFLWEWPNSFATQAHFDHFSDLSNPTFTPTSFTTSKTPFGAKDAPCAHPQLTGMLPSSALGIPRKLASSRKVSNSALSQPVVAHWDHLVIGAGAVGLATGAQLAKHVREDQKPRIKSSVHY